MIELDYEYMLDENGRCLEWYDEDFPSDISVGNNFSYTDETPVEFDETASSLEDDGTCPAGLFYDSVRTIDMLAFSHIHSIDECEDIYQDLIAKHGYPLLMDDAIEFLENYFDTICGGEQL